MMMPLRQVGELYESRHPWTPLKYTISHHLVLIERLKAGSRADVCLVSGPIEQKLLGPLVDPQESVIIGESDLIILIRQKKDDRVKTLADLARPEIASIILPDPKLSSIGAFGREMLDRSGLWPRVADKVKITRLPLNAVAMVVRGEADLTITSRSCGLKTMPDPDLCPMHSNRIKVIRQGNYTILYGDFPTGPDSRLWLTGAILKSSPKKKMAQKFLWELRTGPYQRILHRWGLHLYKRRSPAPPSSVVMED
jgi:ABC-type molybdate transport system substrate-binding protein